MLFIYLLIKLLHKYCILHNETKIVAFLSVYSFFWLIQIAGSRFQFQFGLQTKGYTVLCRTVYIACSQIHIPTPSARYRIGILIGIGIRRCECKLAITGLIVPCSSCSCSFVVKYQLPKSTQSLLYYLYD